MNETWLLNGTLVYENEGREWYYYVKIVGPENTYHGTDKSVNRKKNYRLL